MIDDKGINQSIEEMIPKYSWIYKGSDGLYWTLKIKRHLGVWGNLDDEEDYLWGYKIFFEDLLIWRGCLKGFLSIVPNPEEFFLDFQHSISKIALGVSKYAIPESISLIPRGEGSDRENQTSEKVDDQVDKGDQCLDNDKDQEVNPSSTPISGERPLAMGKKTIRRKSSIKGKTTKIVE